MSNIVYIEGELAPLITNYIYIILEPKEKDSEKGPLEMCALFLGRIPIKGEQCVKILKKPTNHTEGHTEARRYTRGRWDKELEKTIRKQELNQGS